MPRFAGLALLLLSSGLAISSAAVDAATRLTFVRIVQEDPLRISPPRPDQREDRLAIRLRGLPLEPAAGLVVKALRDGNRDGIFEPQEQRELMTLSSEKLGAVMRPLGMDQGLVALPEVAAEVDQLDAELQGADGRWLARPAQLTLRRAPGGLHGLLDRLSQVSSETFDRLVRIYDVVRADGEDSRALYVLELSAGRPTGSPRELDLEPGAVTALALSPDGSVMAWATRNAGAFELRIADTAAPAPRSLFVAPQAIVGIRFLGGERVLLAHGNRLVVIDLETGAPLTYALAVLSVRDLFHAETSGAEVQVALTADIGLEQGPRVRRPLLARLASDGSTVLLRIAAHGLYASAAYMHPQGSLYFSQRENERDHLRYLTVDDEAQHDVVACASAGPLALSQDGARLAWAGTACEASQ